MRSFYSVFTCIQPYHIIHTNTLTCIVYQYLGVTYFLLTLTNKLNTNFFEVNILITIFLQLEDNLQKNIVFQFQIFDFLINHECSMVWMVFSCMKLNSCSHLQKLNSITLLCHSIFICLFSLSPDVNVIVWPN